MELPERIETELELEEVMTRPFAALVEDMSRIEGDLMLLGVAGKMGPTMARLARRAWDEAGRKWRILGVARFSEAAVRDQLEANGIETIVADLLDEKALASLPDVPNIIYLAARKFGSTGNEPLTWAMNTYLAARVAARFGGSRIVALSTGNVYAFSPTDGPGPDESSPVGPVGEYAQSCLGRERMFQYFSERNGTLVSLIRLNYAIDLRYGVLMDVARKVFTSQPIDLTMGHVNVIWQGDANAAILRSLRHCACPPFILNVTGPETISVRMLAAEFGRRLGKEPVLSGTEAPTALLSNATRYHELMGPPQVPLERMIDWVAHWVRIGGRRLNKPTKFESRNGKF
ncbi:MAG: NAD-dependent epimerase/dehydratase family protein [Phycisphaerae bacterium]